MDCEARVGFGVRGSPGLGAPPPNPDLDFRSWNPQNLTIITIVTMITIIAMITVIAMVTIIAIITIITIVTTIKYTPVARGGYSGAAQRLPGTVRRA